MSPAVTSVFQFASDPSWDAARPWIGWAVGTAAAAFQGWCGTNPLAAPSVAALFLAWAFLGGPRSAHALPASGLLAVAALKVLLVVAAACAMSILACQGWFDSRWARWAAFLIGAVAAFRMVGSAAFLCFLAVIRLGLDIGLGAARMTGSGARAEASVLMAAETLRRARAGRR
jgi:hypothetical protein